MAIALGVPGALVPHGGGGGGSGGSSLQALWIDDLATPATVSYVVPNKQGGDAIGNTGFMRFATILYNTAGVQTPSDGEGSYVTYSPGTSNGQEAYIQGPDNMTPSPGCLYWIKFRFDDNDRSRLWLGFFANAVAGFALRTGNPTSPHAALRFQNGDTNFQFISKDGATQEITDTGVAPVNDTIYYLRILVTSGQVDFALYSDAMALLDDAAHVTNVPGDNVELRPTLYSNNDGVNGRRDLQFYSCHVMQLHFP